VFAASKVARSITDKANTLPNAHVPNTDTVEPQRTKLLIDRWLTALPPLVKEPSKLKLLPNLAKPLKEMELPK
jgi:hypothetical protein